MSDFIFARKTSNLILLHSAKARKPKHQSDTHSTGYEGNYCRKTSLYAHGRVQICGFASFGLSLGARKRHLSVLLARFRAKSDYSGCH